MKLMIIMIKNAIDYGKGKKLVAHDKNGVVPLPELKKLLKYEIFIYILSYFLQIGDLVLESSTIGSSGVEPELVKEIVEKAPYRLFVITSKAVKNYRLDNGIPLSEKSDITDASLIYKIAIEHPERMKLWCYNPNRLHRKHQSVRPHDYRDYTGLLPDKWMSRLPPFSRLPLELQQVFGCGAKKKNTYNRALVLPFAMAFDEEGADTRDGYGTIIGYHEHGYPSFYKLAVYKLMRANAKIMFNIPMTNDKKGKIHEEEGKGNVPKPQRVIAWRAAKKQIRKLYHLSKKSEPNYL